MCDVQLPSDKKEAVVRLTSEVLTTCVCVCARLNITYTQPAPKEPAPSTTPAKPGATGYKSIAELSASFVKLLKNSPNQEIPLKYAYIIYYHVVCVYLYLKLNFVQDLPAELPVLLPQNRIQGV